MSIFNHDQIVEELNSTVDTSPAKIRAILTKARELQGISYEEVLALMKCEDKLLLGEMLETANYIKHAIYGKRIVLFAPLYISNLCKNECAYCAFRKSNKLLKRTILSQEQIAAETREIINQGHKRILLVSGEAYPGQDSLQYIFDSIKTVYGVHQPNGNIRRINVNIAPLSVEDFKRLFACNIGTFQCFQETYHRETYEKVHLSGPKSKFDFRVECFDRAFEAGFQDVGMGVLFGLYDWKYEILAMLQVIKHLEEKFGVGPHTISVPRIEPALGSELSYNPPYAVSDDDFLKIIAILRMAVPYTGLILSTRENDKLRNKCIDLGISQISAGSRTNPGGYCEHSNAKEGALKDGAEAQFSLGDSRTLLEVTKELVAHGHIPSFCTGCYRKGRVGKDFMDLAKPGLIQSHCLPNAMFTFAEYINDFGDEELKKSGYALIEKMMNDLPTEQVRSKATENIRRIRNGEHDIFF